MAISNELFDGPNSVDPIVVMEPTRVALFEFLVGTGTIKKGQAVSFHATSKKWAPWDADGANDLDIVQGVAAEDIVLDASDEKLGNVMIAGKVDVTTMPLGSETYPNLITAMRTAALQARGIFAIGVTGVGST